MSTKPNPNPNPDWISLSKETLNWMCSILKLKVKCTSGIVSRANANALLPGLNAAFPNNPELARAAISLVLGAMFQSLQRPTKPLIGSSANCKFTFIDAIRPAAQAPENLFVKVVPISVADDSDPIATDNINGEILNEIIENEPHLAPHFIQYVFSSQTFIHKTPTGKQYLTFEKDFDIMNPKGHFYQPQIRRQTLPGTVINAIRRSITGYKGYAGNAPSWSPVPSAPLAPSMPNSLPPLHDELANMSIFKAIPGKSIQEIFDDHRKAARNNLRDLFLILSRLTDFYEALAYVSVRYGLVHNDMHLGNVRYSSDADTFAIIDLGRLYLQAAHENPHTIHKIRDELLKSGEWESNRPFEDYEQYQYETNSHLFSFDPSGKGAYLTGIMDFITLSMNIYAEFQKIAPGMLQLDPFLSMSGTASKPTFTLPADVDTIITQYLHFSSIRTIPRWVKSVGEGVFYFALFLWHYCTVIKKKRPQPKKMFTVKLEDLVKERYFYWYYQFTSRRSDARSFLTFVYQLFTQHITAPLKQGLATSCHIVREATKILQNQPQMAFSHAGGSEANIHPELSQRLKRYLSDTSLKSMIYGYEAKDEFGRPLKAPRPTIDPNKVDTELYSSEKELKERLEAVWIIVKENRAKRQTHTMPRTEAVPITMAQAIKAYGGADKPSAV